MDDVARTARAHALVLIREFSVRATANALRACRVDSISNSEIALLIRLAASDELRPRDLRRDIPLTSGGMANLLGRLEEEGLIVRNRPTSGDQRAVTVALTERGADRQRCLAQAIVWSLSMDGSVVKEVAGLLEIAGARPVDVEVPAAPSAAGRITLGLARVGVVLVAAIESGEAGPDGLNRAIVLAALRSGDPLRPNQIAHILGITSGGASRLIDRLAADGLVTRNATGETDDARGVHVVVTATGRAQVDAMLDRIEPCMHELLTLLQRTLHDLPSALTD